MKPENLSVTISLYNKENTIKRAVKSVLGQSEAINHIIIVDDGSTDNSSNIAKSLSNRFKQVTYVHQKNSGVSVARNRGVEEVTTRYVSFLDADDVWESHYVNNLMELINHVKNADFYCLAYQMHTDMGIYKQSVALPENFKGIVKNPIKTYNKGYGLIHTSAICFDKDFFHDLGGFPVGVNFGEDIYLWLKACTEGQLAFYNKVSVTLHKQPINSINRRKLDPYHLSYFIENLDKYDSKVQKQLKHFLIKNTFIQWAAAKIEKNRWQRKILRSYVYKINKPQWLILLFSELIPARFFDMIRRRRIRTRLKN